MVFRNLDIVTLDTKQTRLRDWPIIALVEKTLCQFVRALAIDTTFGLHYSVLIAAHFCSPVLDEWVIDPNDITVFSHPNVSIVVVDHFISRLV